MKARRLWVAFALCSLGWFYLSAAIAPEMSGGDVFVFRDAGWNLAASGSFVSAALPYMHDLTPQLFAHYTPLMPLLFAGYASLLPRNAYSGTFFNLVIGLLAAGVSLYLVLKLPSGGSKLKSIVALTIAVVPAAFVIFDRPETLGFVLAVFAIGAAARVPLNPWLVGLLVAVTFLAHPFAAIIAAVWCLMICFLRNRHHPAAIAVILKQVAIMGSTALALLLPVNAALLHTRSTQLIALRRPRFRQQNWTRCDHPI